MPLAPGTWLNHYEVLEHIGSGGMGEVYRALDNKLQREVALKVLPKAFAQDPERLARFRREAQVLAQLNHVNIAAIYTVEQSGDTHFLVMELAQGETLRDRIKRGSAAVSAAPASQRDAGATSRPVPLEEALDICKQIAAGLECAHEKPIVHRDLKPANIKVTPEGVVKILDFGLARAFSGDSGSTDPADSPTLSAMTAPGTILGTAAYMSPEQARGKKVDKRTDIWALGCVLYELLTGQQAFDPSRDREGAGNREQGIGNREQSPARQGGGQESDANTIADIIGAVLYKEPDWSALPATTPTKVRDLLRRCLEKDAKRRYSSAADLQIQIDEALTTPSTAAPSVGPPPPPRPIWRRAMPWAIAVFATALVTGLAIWNLRPAPPPQPVTRLVVALPPGERLRNPGAPAVEISPDGKLLAYVTGSGVMSQIHLRAMDSPDARSISGTEGGTYPFFSPDSQWLGFFGGGKLQKVSVSGGAPVTLTSEANIGAHRGASWGADDTIVYAPNPGSGLFQVSAAGGKPKPLTQLDSGKGEFSHRWPQVLPNGRAVLFTVYQSGTSSDDAQIEAQSLETGERKVLIRGGTHGRYVPTGHLLYVRAGTLMAVLFDLDRLEVTGAPTPILDGILQNASEGDAEYAFSQQGTFVFQSGGVEGGTGTPRTLVWVDRNGTETPLPAPPREYDDPRISPDGQQVVVEIGGGTSDIWIYDLARATLARLTFEGAARDPLWTPDGKRIVYRSLKPGASGLFWKPADGSGPEESLLQAEAASGSSVTPDGKTLAFFQADPRTLNDIWTVPLEGERKPESFLQTPFREQAPMFSPDGRWLAYSSEESGQMEVYVQAFPGPGGKWLISSDGGWGGPVWSRNGRELFYQNGAKMMAVEITTQPTFRAGTPRMLFENPGYLSFLTRADYDISPDGQRFLMVKETEEQGAVQNQIHVVLNWFEELKRRVPVP